MDFEMFVDFTEREVVDNKTPKDEHRNDVKLHFEPARSLVDPKQPLLLAVGMNLVDFTPKFKVWEQLTGITIAGTKAGTRRRHTMRIGVSDAEIEKDLKKPAGQEGKNTLDAGKARAKFFGPMGKEGKDSDNAPSSDSANLDEKRAKLKGIAMLRKSLRELLTATGSTYGMPNLRPGVYVEIYGMFAPFDGYGPHRRRQRLPHAVHAAAPRHARSEKVPGAGDIIIMNELFSRLRHFEERWHRDAPMFSRL
jgi:hypothetical protein